MPEPETTPETTQEDTQKETQTEQTPKEDILTRVSQMKPESNGTEEQPQQSTFYDPKKIEGEPGEDV